MERPRRLDLCRVAPAAAPTLAAMPAAAIPLGPGDAGVPAGRTAAGSPELAGVVIYDQLRSDFVQVAGPGPADDVTLGYDVRLQTRVVRSSLDNTLDFYFLFRNHDDLTYPLFQIDAFGFAGFDVDADFRTDAVGTVTPSAVQRSGGDGDGVRFAFGTAVVPPQDGGTPGRTRFLLIDTVATEWDLGGSLTLAGGLSSTDPTVRELTGTPRPVVPEPASALLAAAAGVALLGRRRRRRTPT